MSMEQAILELASGMKELAAAVRSGFSSPQMIAGIQQVEAALAPLVEKEVAIVSTGAGAKRIKATLTDSAAESMAAADQAHPEEVKPDAELEAAVSKVEEAAKPLDYQVDVRPVLMAVAKSKDLGAPKLKELLAKYGAPNGDKLKPTDYAAILADANELLGN